MRGPTRLAGVALAATLTLAIAGCGSDASDGAAGDEEPADEAGGAEDANAPTGLPGVWIATSDTEALLRVGEEGVAALVLPSEVCLGAAVQRAGQILVAVDCAEDARHGAGRAVLDGRTLTVDWEGGADGGYERLADADADLGDLPLGDHGLDEVWDSVPDALGPDADDPPEWDAVQDDLDGLLPDPAP